MADRNERYLPAMEGYEKRMSSWTGDDLEVEAPAVYCMATGQRRVVNIVHDECIVYSNDATQVLWEENGSQGVATQVKRQVTAYLRFLLLVSRVCSQ